MRLHIGNEKLPNSSLNGSGGFYASLGVRPVVNAAGALSRLGGSLLSLTVREAMSQAAQSFIDLPHFHDRAGEELARITNNEAACVSNGAAAGILISVAACLAGDDIEMAKRLPDAVELKRRDVVVWRQHVEGFLAGADQVIYNGYLSGVAMAGGILRIVDRIDELLPGAVCMLWFPKVFPKIEREEFFFQEFLAKAHSLNIPFIVDAADQVPPVSNLWYFTKDKGADLAIFSGGKGLRGPQSSGLIVGKMKLIKACRTNSGPEHSIGRPAKVGKEEIAGLLAAVKESLTSNWAHDFEKWEKVVNKWLADFAELESLGVVLRASSTSHSGQPIPRVILTLENSTVVIRDQIIEFLWEKSPHIAVLPEGDVAIALNPHMIQEDEIRQVSQSVIFAIRKLVIF
jgi:uncharacterized pyridoxal phosphate-dependent enzyme